MIRGYEIYKNKFLEKLEKQGMFDLVDKYIDSGTEVTFKCKNCGYEFKLRPDRIFYKRCCQNCIDRKILYKYEEHKSDFIQKLKENGKFELVSEYVGSHGGKMKFKCLKCGFIFKTTRKESIRKKYCPECLKIVSRVGENNEKSMIFTNPDLSKNLLNKKDAKLYGENSKEKLKWKCSICGTTIVRSPISFRGGFKCKVCSDGISYPNKFFASFLKELNEEYEPEKVFNWSNFGDKSCFRYDFYIESKNMIVEVMGEQHYSDKLNFFGKTYNETYENDSKKEELARNNGIENYIKINCKRTDFSYMKKSIIKEMSLFFDVTKLDWKNIKTRSLKNRTIEVCEYYDKHKDVGVVELAKIFKTDAGTIWRYLKLGQECGSCNYTLEDSHRREVANRWKSRRENLELDVNLIAEYYSKNKYTSVNHLSEKFKMKRNRVIKCLLLGDRSNKCIFPRYKHLENKILQFDLDGNFLKSFNTLEDAANEIGATSSGISSTCKKKILLCKNYIFRNNKIY